MSQATEPGEFVNPSPETPPVNLAKLEPQQALENIPEEEDAGSLNTDFQYITNNNTSNRPIFPVRTNQPDSAEPKPQGTLLAYLMLKGLSR